MPQTMFSIDGVAYPHIRVLSCEQTFQVLDKDSKRSLAGNMNRNIIGTYYNYKLKIKPENSQEGMSEYAHLWYVCSTPTESHTLVVPFDCESTYNDNTHTFSGGGVHTTKTYQAYITSGAREMTKYNVNGVDYWGAGELNFIAMDKAR